MITYLQRRNPSVSGIASKLYPSQERKIKNVKKYWRVILELQPILEIYSGIELQKNDMSIDHFVSGAYVGMTNYGTCTRQHEASTE